MADKLLHIYAQDSWHQPATIIGNREALEHLVAVLHRALEMPPETELSFETMVIDGEGYDVRIIRLDDVNKWVQVAVPYTDEMCQGLNTGKVYP